MEVKGAAGGDLVQMCKSFPQINTKMKKKWETIPSYNYEDKEKVWNRKRLGQNTLHLYIYRKENSELKKLKDEDKEKEEKHRTRLDAHNLYTEK